MAVRTELLVERDGLKEFRAMSDNQEVEVVIIVKASNDILERLHNTLFDTAKMLGMLLEDEAKKVKKDG